MLRIGITIGLRHGKESIWVNGIKQTAVFFAKMLKASSKNYDVVLVNTTSVDLETAELPWDKAEYPVVSYDQAKNNLDVLFIVGGAITQHWLDDLKALGAKVVSFRLGSEYFVSMERIIFNQQINDSRPTHLLGFDEMWFIPQVWEANAPYLQVLHQLKTEQIKKVPFIWDPMFIEEALQTYENKGEYRPRVGAKRLSCFEPNLNVLKTFIYPLFIAEQVYREQPDAIEFMSILGSQYFKSNEEFLGVIEHLKIIQKKGKCYFEDRHITPLFLAEHTDIVVSHQIFNPLNNLTLEVAWLGYPLVHNSPLCKNLGYYYEGFDVAQGAQQLSYAINQHDDNWRQYRDSGREEVQQYLPTNPQLIAHYDALLENLF